MIDALTVTLTALGFQPIVTQRLEDQLTICLRNCLYREAVRENQPAICSLHKGITRGVLDALDPDTVLTGFVANNPDTAHCLIEIRTTTDDAPAAHRAKTRRSRAT